MIVTTDVIKSCITKNVSKVFDGITIYKDDVLQGLHTPCFFIRLLESNQEKRGPFYERNYTFALRYHSSERESSNDIDSVQDKIYEHLTTLFDDQLVIQCQKPKCQIQDGVLHTILEYKVRLLKKEETNSMQCIEEITGGIL